MTGHRYRWDRRSRARVAQPTAGRVFCLALWVLSGPALNSAAAAGPASPAPPARANFAQEPASADARYVADWVIGSGDSQGLPFLVVDKKQARVYVFAADASLRGTAPALLGLAVGDEAVPGIGDRKLSTIRPDERTTPAGRYLTSIDRNLQGHEILWVDYASALSLHPVITTNAKERRAERLASPTPLDNRISYGCINVTADFFREVVKPVFTRTNGIVYVLPETRPVQQEFAPH